MKITSKIEFKQNKLKLVSIHHSARKFSKPFAITSACFGRMDYQQQ
jgi:hypothetical protein